MKIAVISSLSNSLVSFRGRLLEDMIDLGYEVLAFAPNHDFQTRAWLLNRGVKPIDYTMSRTGMNPLRDLSSILELWSLLRRHRPDIVMGYYIKPAIYGTIAARLSGVSRRYVMIEGLGYAFTKGGKPSFKRKIAKVIAKILYRVAISNASFVIFLNKDDLNEFLFSNLVKLNKSGILGGIGVDFDEWKRQPFSISPITFLFVGRILRDKGVEDYIQAARILRIDYPCARFILLGGIDENPESITRDEVDSWVREGLIEWPGHVNVKPWLRQAHVFVLPSYREGVPRSTQEAMAMGRPVITTDVPGCRDTVVNGVNGYLVPVQSPDELAAAMRFFLDNPEKIEVMGNQSRSIAEERFDVRRQNRKLLDFLQL